VECAGTVLRGQNATYVPIAVPLPPPPCPYIGIPENQSNVPLLKSIDDFDPKSYNRQEYLDPDRTVLLHWSIDKQNSIARFAVEAVTAGWVGFGISPNKGMVGSDIAMGWVVNRTANAFDRFAEGRFLPPDDHLQDLFAVHVSEGVPGQKQDDTAKARWEFYIAVLSVIGLIVLGLAAAALVRKRRRANIVPTESDKTQYGTLGAKEPLAMA